MDRDKFYMEKALELARRGEGSTGANPLVGAVVVKDDQIVGSGYHQYYGGPHAEVYALKEAGDRAAGADLYVNLEPCCHEGKTGPCSMKVIQSGIDRLVIGMIDPHSRVAGKGIEAIKKAGIEVKTGVLEQECRRLNEIFLKYISTDLPFVMLKAAQTLDGYLAAKTGDSKWITNKTARQYGHKLRHRAAAVMVGSGTVLEDNPSLTTRLEGKQGTDALRIILDSKLRTPVDSNLIDHQSPEKTLIVCGHDLDDKQKEKKKSLLAEKKVDIIQIKLTEDGKVPLKKLLKKLHDMEIASVLIEGGGHLNYSFLSAGLVDKVYIFTAPRIYGGNDGVATFMGPGPEKMDMIDQIRAPKIKELEENFLLTGYLNEKLVE